MIPGLKSLRVRVMINVFATSIIMLSLYGALVFSQITVVTDELARENLLEQARRLASYLEYDQNGNLTIDFPGRDSTYYNNEAGEHQYAVMNTKWEYLFHSANFMKEETRHTLEEGGKHFFEFVTEDEQTYMALKYDYLFKNNVYPVYIVEKKEIFLKFLSNLQSRFNVNVLAYGLPLIFLQGLLIIFIFRSALYPIIRVARDAENIKFDNLSFRLDEKDIPAEVLPLIESVNNGLARLEDSAQAEKMFIANAAHELRTPISILKARISSLQNEKEIFALNQDLRHINRLISQMLDISHLDLLERPPLKEMSLNETARRACEEIGPLFIAENRMISFEEKSKDQMIEGNEEMVFRAILNLLENALKYTPPNSAVKVIIEDQKIIVRDYGKEISEDYREKIFDRFEKAPENLNSKGSGLGLAIVKKTAEIHNAKAILSVRDNGNDFILDFNAD